MKIYCMLDPLAAGPWSHGPCMRYAGSLDIISCPWLVFLFLRGFAVGSMLAGRFRCCIADLFSVLRIDVGALTGPMG